MSNVVQFPPRLELDIRRLQEKQKSMSDLVLSLGIGPAALPYIGHMAFLCSSQPKLMLDLMNRGLSPSDIAQELLERSIREVEDFDISEELRECGIDPDTLKILAAATRDEDQPLS